MTPPTPPFGREGIERLVPHRPPFLYIDRVLAADSQRAEARVTFPGDLPLFAGHFPGRPTVPGVMLLEAMAQAALVLYQFNYPTEDLLYLSKADTRFKAPALPDEELAVKVESIKVVEGGGLVRGEILRGEQLLATAKMGFAVPGFLEA